MTGNEFPWWGAPLPPARHRCSRYGYTTQDPGGPEVERCACGGRRPVDRYSRWKQNKWSEKNSRRNSSGPYTEEDS